MEQANAQILIKVSELKQDLESKQNEYVQRRSEGEDLENEVRRNQNLIHDLRLLSAASKQLM